MASVLSTLEAKGITEHDDARGTRMVNWRSLIDVREGERLRVVYMTLYLLLVLFAYYILKPVSRAMFLNNFRLDHLPWLYIVVAFAGGGIAFLFTRTAVRFSLQAAMTLSTATAVGALILFWWLLGMDVDWMIYLFNIFVSVFSITLVSQGWLLAANVFNNREAKRVYAILGGGAVFGAAFGGSFTAISVEYLGTRTLLLVSAGLVGLSYTVFLLLSRLKGVAIAQARGMADGEQFVFGEILAAIRKHRHLQMIVGIIAVTYMVDVMVEYQFSAMAKSAYGGDDLTAFLGGFFGLWLNLISFVLQFFVTSAVVSRFGIGATLQIMPVMIAGASMISFISPGVVSASAARLTEAATRYSFNRTGMELLYLPLPGDLRNRTKAFVDIFVDRLARGVGGLLLVFLTAGLALPFRYISLVVIGFAAVWIGLAALAKNEYIATVRKRLALRRLDLEALRVRLNDPATLRLLAETAESTNARQAVYSLSLLAESTGYNFEPLLGRLRNSEFPEIRAKAYEIASNRGLRVLLDRAEEELEAAESGPGGAAVRAAVEYAIALSPDSLDLATQLINHPNLQVAEIALSRLAQHPEFSRQCVSREWMTRMAETENPRQRKLAAIALRLYPDEQILLDLLHDPDADVAGKASETAAALGPRFLGPLMANLANARVRRHAIAGLASFGEPVVAALGDALRDVGKPSAVRVQIPRVLTRIGGQKAVEVLFENLAAENLLVRTAVLKALNKLRERQPGLRYEQHPVVQQIMEEARYFHELNADLAPLREVNRSASARLLARTLETRLRESLERMFRLLGLRYPPKEIYAAYLAVNRRETDEAAAALEFLDNVLERELKKILLPLIDDEPSLMQTARQDFGVQPKDVRTALRELIRAGDTWVRSCAIASAGELRLRELAAEIAPYAERGTEEVRPVAQAAVVALGR